MLQMMAIKNAMPWVYWSYNNAGGNYPFYLQSSVKDNLFSIFFPPGGGHATHCSKFEVPFWLPLRDPF